MCGVESELSSKTEGIGVPPALEKEPGKEENRTKTIYGKLRKESEKRTAVSTPILAMTG